VSGLPGEAPTLPPTDCPLCPRLAEYRQANQAAHGDWFNGPVPSFGSLDARLLIVGLAPGVRGANRTGRPFTGDYAGDLLYRTLLQFGMARGRYGADPGDGMTLVDCRVTNAVRCVPPGNLPTPGEITTCNRFLEAEIAAMPRLRGLLALGGTAHNAVLRAHGLRPARVKFRHGAMHDLPGNRVVADSYHVSRLNTNTGRLTEAMFHAVVQELLAHLGQNGA
jgi:uracil-DNA glycosylase family 4